MTSRLAQSPVYPNRTEGCRSCTNRIGQSGYRNGSDIQMRRTLRETGTPRIFRRSAETGGTRIRSITRDGAGFRHPGPRDERRPRLQDDPPLKRIAAPIRCNAKPELVIREYSTDRTAFLRKFRNDPTVGIRISQIDRRSDDDSFPGLIHHPFTYREGRYCVLRFTSFILHCVRRVRIGPSLLCRFGVRKAPEEKEL